MQHFLYDQVRRHMSELSAEFGTAVSSWHIA